MQKTKANVLVDGQWGSCGKGWASSVLVDRYRPDILSSCNMPNAGHCVQWRDGRRYIHKVLPSGASIAHWIKRHEDQTYNPLILVGASSVFDSIRLRKEINDFNFESEELYIHPRSMVLAERHVKSERIEGGLENISSTMQGSSAAMIEKIRRIDESAMFRNFVVDHSSLQPYVGGDGGEFEFNLNLCMTDQRNTLLHEVAQGFSLGINHGSHYPQCTSRNCTAAQGLADMGVGLDKIGDVYMVIRPYPIRVGNIDDSKNSGGCYYDQNEIEWEDVVRAGVETEEKIPEDLIQNRIKYLKDAELTTVTKRMRRVFTFSRKQVEIAVEINGVNKLMLNFANYLDWGVTGCNQWSELRKSDRVMRWIRECNEIARVVCVGTGPSINDVTWVGKG